MHPGPILTINCGSSSVRVACFDAARQWHAHLSGIGRRQTRLIVTRAGETQTIDLTGAADHRQALDAVFRFMPAIAPAAVGHRIVHGGADFVTPTQLEPPVEARLRELAFMAPLHQEANLDGVDAARSRWPLCPQIGCFDTAFHASMPKPAAMMALPRDLYAAGVRRFGFHGLSVASILASLAQERIDIRSERIIVAHLGAGASMTAIQAGRSIETSMGFSTVSGLPMATRSGDIDPGVVLHLARSGRGLDEVEALLYRQSGLLGLSGFSGDMAALLASSDPSAEEAVEVFCRASRRWLAGLAGVLGGVDRVVFTGGIGEHAPHVRAKICKDLGFMGVELDAAANEGGAGLIAPPSGRVIVEVRAADEEAEIARQTSSFMAAAS